MTMCMGERDGEWLVAKLPLIHVNGIDIPQNRRLRGV
jgi:hypothetical protein